MGKKEKIQYIKVRCLDYGKQWFILRCGDWLDLTAIDMEFGEEWILEKVNMTEKEYNKLSEFEGF